MLQIHKIARIRSRNVKFKLDLNDIESCKQLLDKGKKSGIIKVSKVCLVHMSTNICRLSVVQSIILYYCCET